MKKKIVAKKPLKKEAVLAKSAASLPAKPVVKPSVPAVVPVVSKRVLYVEVTPDRQFVLCDGRKIRSGKELADILQLMNDDMFKYHVTDNKNDFSNWINDVFGEPELAKKLRTVRNRLETSIELYRYMFDKLDKSTKK